MTATLTQKRIRMSRQEFDRLPEGPPYYDYIQGEAIEVNRPTGEHQEIVVWLASKLWEYARQNGLGKVWADINVDLPTGDLIGPDIVYLATENLHLYSRGYIQGTPDLVVEVLSPSNASYDRVEKLDAYRRASVPWVWLIDPETLVVEEYRWTPEGYLLVSTTPPTHPFEPKRFPGLKLELGATFSAPPKQEGDSSLRSE
jgi:Uma2 family endonuclease